jgi:hypothetical protein
METAYEEDRMGLLESMTDEEFIAYVEEVRPHLLTEQDDGDAEDAEDGGDDELAEMVAKLKKKNPKLSDKQAEAMAKQALAKSAQEANTEEDDDMGAITPEALQEALQSEDFQGVLDPIIKPLVEAAVADERELIRAEARADAERQLTLRDMRDEAHRQISEANLPEAFSKKAKALFEITDNGPTAALDVVDDVDDDGNVTKKAEVKLTEAVSAVIAEERELVSSVSPTRVRGQGPGTPAKRGENGDGEGGEEPKKGEGTLYGSLLQEAGVDPSTAWDD